jgi:7,8-dihydroneopterin aldolase/epimerase/oxygenase
MAATATTRAPAIARRRSESNLNGRSTEFLARLGCDRSRAGSLVSGVRRGRIDDRRIRWVGRPGTLAPARSRVALEIVFAVCIDLADIAFPLLTTHETNGQDTGNTEHSSRGKHRWLVHSTEALDRTTPGKARNDRERGDKPAPRSRPARGSSARGPAAPMLLSVTQPDVVFIRGLEFEGNHGYTAAERRSTRRFRLGIEMQSPLAEAARSDRLSDTIDYRAICALAIDIGTKSTFKLLEALAGNIAAAIHERYPHCQVEIVLEKLAPPCPGVPASCGVRLFFAAPGSAT